VRELVDAVGLRDAVVHVDVLVHLGPHAGGGVQRQVAPEPSWRTPERRRSMGVPIVPQATTTRSASTCRRPCCVRASTPRAAPPSVTHAGGLRAGDGDRAGVPGQRDVRVAGVLLAAGRAPERADARAVAARGPRGAGTRRSSRAPPPRAPSRGRCARRARGPGDRRRRCARRGGSTGRAPRRSTAPTRPAGRAGSESTWPS
jgi:hypothetical protein